MPVEGIPGSQHNAWYHESVDYVLSKGIMQGYGDGTFRPDETATRAQVVTLLYRIAGEPAVVIPRSCPSPT